MDGQTLGSYACSQGRGNALNREAFWSWSFAQFGASTGAPLSTPGSAGGCCPALTLHRLYPKTSLGRRGAGGPQGCLLPSKQPSGPSWEGGRRASSPQRGSWHRPQSTSPYSVLAFRSRFLRVVLARSRTALPGISDSCLELQLFPDKRLAPPRLGLGLFGECCRGGLSCSLLQECWPDGQILLPSCKMSDVGRLWESSLPVPPPLDKPAWPAPPCHGNRPFQPQPQ